MTEAKGNSFITDPSDLQYISDLVNQVLEQKHELGSIHDFQLALKEVSLSQGREVQMNLVSDKNKWVGFNFSFKNDPNKTTSTIPFKQQLELEERGGSITPLQGATSAPERLMANGFGCFTSGQKLLKQLAY
jgi:hypothetical protein